VVALAGDDLLAWLGPRKTRMFLRKYAHTTPRGVKQVELFSNLIEMVEEMIDKPAQLRRRSSWLIGAKTEPVGTQHGNRSQVDVEQVAVDELSAGWSPEIGERTDAATAATRRARRPAPPPRPPLRSARVAAEPPSCCGACLPTAASDAPAKPTTLHRNAPPPPPPPPPAAAAAAAAAVTTAARQPPDDDPVATKGQSCSRAIAIGEPSPRQHAERSLHPLRQAASEGDMAARTTATSSRHAVRLVRLRGAAGEAFVL
jgi:hypothetical protein